MLDYSSMLIRQMNLDDNFYVIDLGHCVRAVQAWRAAMPRVRPFYAVKCHPDPGMIATLASMGCGFDCASPAEIDMVRPLTAAACPWPAYAARPATPA